MNCIMEVILSSTEIGNVGFSRDGKEIVLLCSTGPSATLYCWDTDIPRVRPRLSNYFPSCLSFIEFVVMP